MKVISPKPGEITCLLIGKKSDRTHGNEPDDHKGSCQYDIFSCSDILDRYVGRETFQYPFWASQRREDEPPKQSTQVTEVINVSIGREAKHQVDHQDKSDIKKHPSHPLTKQTPVL